MDAVELGMKKMLIRVFHTVSYREKMVGISPLKRRDFLEWLDGDAETLDELLFLFQELSDYGLYQDAVKRIREKHNEFDYDFVLEISARYGKLYVDSLVEQDGTTCPQLSHCAFERYRQENPDVQKYPKRTEKNVEIMLQEYAEFVVERIRTVEMMIGANLTYEMMRDRYTEEQISRLKNSIFSWQKNS